MSKINIFIMPESIQSINEEHTLSYESYLDNIHEIAFNSEFSLYIKPLIPENIRHKIPINNHFNSASNEDNLRGEISPNDWNRFKDIITNKKNYSNNNLCSDIKIHGIYSQGQPQQFAMQLLGYLNDNINIHNFWPNNNSQKSYQNIENLLKEYEEKEIFKKSTIRFGCLYGAMPADYKKPKLRSKGNLFYQLTDNNSISYPRNSF